MFRPPLINVKISEKLKTMSVSVVPTLRSVLSFLLNPAILKSRILFLFKYHDKTNIKSIVDEINKVKFGWLNNMAETKSTMVKIKPNPQNVPSKPKITDSNSSLNKKLNTSSTKHPPDSKMKSVTTNTTVTKSEVLLSFSI